MNRTAFALLFAMLPFLPQPALSQDTWRTPAGEVVPETAARKAKNGLGVWLIVTADPDWQAKWDTPSHQTPHISEAQTVSTGGRLTILTFVVNPQPDSQNNLKVLSRITVTRPNGTFSMNAAELPCLKGRLLGSPTNVRLCEAVIQFSADPEDPPGAWNVDVAVKDVNRNTEVPVHATFTLEGR